MMFSTITRLGAAAFRRWKAKHWDHQFFCNEYEHFSHAGFDSPPLRAVWEKYRKPVLKFFPWVSGLLAGAVILKVLGL